MKEIRIFILLFVLFLSGSSLFSQTNLLFKPLTANTFEPRTGGQLEFGSKKLRLDIGASVDLLKFKPSDDAKLNLGADFFTYTRLRSEGNFKFPVETSDYFFGVNASYLTKYKDVPVSARFRLAHISSHLVDGMAKDTIFSRMPFVYSREFADLTGTIEIAGIRWYAGLDYVFSTKPKDPDKLIPQVGFDFERRFNSWLKLLGGYDFKLIGISGTYSGVNTAQIGLLFQSEENLGVLLNLYGFSGKSIHGMFYMQNDSYLGLGFQVYFY